MSGERKNGLTYAEAGVSIEEGARLVAAVGPEAKRTARPGVMGGLGGFGALFDLEAAGHAGSVLVAATDGVGTKLKVGIECDRLDGLGIDLVAMCVNDLLCQGAEPLFFLDYFATGALDADRAARVVAGVADGCVEAGCALVGGETAEMPGLYAPGDFDLAGFAVGAVPRSSILPRQAVVGDVLLGLPSSGAHSNGFSLIRRIVADQGLGWDATPFADVSLGEAFTRPTRIYVRAGLAALASAEGGAIRGFAHITGGGVTENLPRILGDGLTASVDLAALKPQPEFAWLAEAGGVAEAEMLRAFNCGVGLIAVVAVEAAEAVAETLRAAGEAPFVLGEIVAGEGAARVAYRGRLFG